MDELILLKWVSGILALLLIVAGVALTGAFWERQALRADRSGANFCLGQMDRERIANHKRIGELVDNYAVLEKRHDLLAKQNEEYETELTACRKQFGERGNRIETLTSEREHLQGLLKAAQTECSYREQEIERLEQSIRLYAGQVSEWQATANNRHAEIEQLQQAKERDCIALDLTRQQWEQEALSLRAKLSQVRELANV